MSKEESGAKPGQKVGRGQVVLGYEGHGKKSGIYSGRAGKPWGEG